MPDTSFPHWPFFEDRHRAYADKLEAWAVADLQSVDHRRCRCRLPQTGGGARRRDGWLQHTAPGRRAAEKLDVRTLALTPRNAGAPLRSRRFRLRHAGPRRRADFAVRRRRRSAAHGCRRRAPARPLRAFAFTEAASGSDVANITDHATARWRQLCHRRREDLDFQWWHRRSLCGLRPHRRSAGRARTCRPSSSTVQSRASSIAERIEVIAPHPLARLTFKNCRVPRRRADRRRLATASRSRWRRSTCSAPRSAPPRSALPAARSMKPCKRAANAPAVRRAPRRSADGAGPHRGHGARYRRCGAARLSRRLDQG